jgi:SHS2 domain-containing protein
LKTAANTQFQFFDHDADMGIAGHGGSLEEAFA